jgi:hypothetical protein
MILLRPFLFVWEVEFYSLLEGFTAFQVTNDVLKSHLIQFLVTDGFCRVQHCVVPK